jgi:hypothetical protein
MWFSLILWMALMPLMGQTRKPIDWKPCQDVTKQFTAQVQKFNAENKDGFQINLYCTYSGDPERNKLPEQHIALTPSEVKHLHALRQVEHASFEAMDDFEDTLFRAHHVRKPKIDEPCFYYAGIVWDKDYITVDPNPLFSEPGECDDPVKWRLQ